MWSRAARQNVTNASEEPGVSLSGYKSKLATVSPETPAMLHQATRRHTPEDSNIHNFRREYLKSHSVKYTDNFNWRSDVNK
jgi:hypothetical protein